MKGKFVFVVKNSNVVVHTWWWVLRSSSTDLVNHIAPVRVRAVDTGNLIARGIMIGIWITSCAIPNVGIIIPLHETTLVCED